MKLVTPFRYGRNTINDKYLNLQIIFKIYIMDTLIKWNDYSVNVTKSFDSLRSQNSFYDVTLVSDDQQRISAHKVILSAGSEYFKNVLTSQSHPHPLLCLDGVSYAELKSIIDYIYCGEVRVKQDDIVKFLKIAQKFGIEGIMKGKKQAHIKQEKDIVAKPRSDVVTPGVPGPEMFERGSKPKIEPRRENWFQMLSEEEKSSASSNLDSSFIDSDTETIQEDSESPGKRRRREDPPVIKKIKVNHDNLDQIMEENISKIPDSKSRYEKYSCNLCGRTARNKAHVKDHIEIHLDGLQYPCKTPSCDKVFQTKNSLRVHVFKCSRQSK